MPCWEDLAGEEVPLRVEAIVQQIIQETVTVPPGPDRWDRDRSSGQAPRLATQRATLARTAVPHRDL